MEDKTFKAAPIDVANLFGNKDTGKMAQHILGKMSEADKAGAISGASNFDSSRVYKHIATGETANQHFIRTKKRKPASVHELANHFHEHRHSFMGHKKEAKASSEKKESGY